MADADIHSQSSVRTSYPHGGVHNPEHRDERAERLLHEALDVAVRIRDEDPAAVRSAVDCMPTDELRDAFLLLAACVPVDLPTSVLLGWYLNPSPAQLRPCGTPAAAKRHRAHGEELDDACRTAEREYSRIHKRNSRASVQEKPVGVACDSPAEEAA